MAGAAAKWPKPVGLSLQPLTYGRHHHYSRARPGHLRLYRTRLNGSQLRGCPDQLHNCPVPGSGLRYRDCRQPMVPSAGLVPAVHVFMRTSCGGGEDVDARAEPAQGVFQVATRGSSDTLTLWRNLNRTGVGSTRRFTASRAVGVDAGSSQTKSGHDWYARVEPDGWIAT